MATTEEQLEQLKGSLQSTLGPALAMAGVSNPYSAAVLFGVDMIFRFVKLGMQIKKALEDARQSLDRAVRAESIFRVPIEVNMTFSKILGFFTKGDCELLYPTAYQQFKREREIIIDRTHPEWQEAFDTLALAYRVLPEIYFDYKFDSSPLLDDLFGKWLDPGNPDFRTLIKEMKPFLSHEELSLPDLARLLPEYSQMKLQLMGARLENLTQSALADLNQKIHDLVWETLFGQSGAVKAVTKFAVDRRIEQLDQQIAQLQDRKGVLEGKPEGDRSEAEKKELKRIDQRIGDLTEMKTRIQSAAGANG